MNKFQLSEQRRQQRHVLNGLMPGNLCREGGEGYICARPIDVSKEGMGILTSETLEIGDRLTLTVRRTGLKLVLEVLWARPDFGKRDLKRYGLQSLEPHIDLAKVFYESHCLKV